jgi:hypothetical protein
MFCFKLLIDWISQHIFWVGSYLNCRKEWFHFISDTLYITVGNRDHTCTNTFSPEQSQVMLKTFWNPKHANTLYFQSTEMHSTQQFWVMNQKHFKTGCSVLDYYLGMGFCLSKNNIIFSLSILSNYHSTITSHFQWTTHSFLFLYMTTSSAHSDEAGEIFRKVMLSDSDRLFSLDFLSLSELQFK